ncbi:MAG: hypothetical protein HC893_03615 [Chloroflexaceae bacterium]|nr:hypothetical protein [Chloroflexaceae bacterium]NJL33093.1 hypothetical protein [Chloroflexaceae bacterium]NJO04179.1 hypothetical protein [Chloroflexaceae bacterium]
MATYDREQIRAALTEVDNSYSNYLDLETGTVLRINDTDPSQETLRNQLFEGYGARYRYIPGGNPGATDSDVQIWIEAEGI